MRQESCVHYRKATLGLTQPLDADRERRTLQTRAPLGQELLRRMQNGALASPITKPDFKAAIRATLERGTG